MPEAVSVTTTTTTATATATTTTAGQPADTYSLATPLCLENTPASSRIQMPALFTHPAHTLFNT